MSGMDMMFKAMGLDPEIILKSAEEFKAGLAHLNESLEIIKAQNEKILNVLVPTIMILPGDTVPCDENGHVFGRVLEQANGG